MEWIPDQSIARDRCDYRDFGLLELPDDDGAAAEHLLPVVDIRAGP